MKSIEKKRKYKKRKIEKNINENQTIEKLQKRKGGKKRREGITRRESPHPRPIKKSSTTDK